MAPRVAWPYLVSHIPVVVCSMANTICGVGLQQGTRSETTPGRHFGHVHPQLFNAGSLSVSELKRVLPEDEVLYGLVRMGFGAGQFRRSVCTEYWRRGRGSPPGCICGLRFGSKMWCAV